MMFRLFFILLTLVSTSALKAQDLGLYWLSDLEQPYAYKKVGFISLSDSYDLSEHADSLAVPNLEYVEKKELQYFKLNSEYRKRFLSKTKVSETDKVFIYDYSTDVLLSFSVKDLNVVANLNFYSSVDDCNPCDQYDYMIGFEINKYC